MEDIEAYGQLRDRPLPRRGRPAPPAPAPDAPEILAPPRRARRSHLLRNAVLVICAYFAFAACTTVQPLPLPGTDARIAAPFPGGALMLFGLPDRPFTVLVIGLDRRPTESGASRADTVLLLRIDPGSDRAAFLSIPRDTMLAVPLGEGEYTRDRVNTAFVYNYSDENRSAAPRAVMAASEHSLGIRVDPYVVFDQATSEKLIDAMGADGHL